MDADACWGQRWQMPCSCGVLCRAVQALITDHLSSSQTHLLSNERKRPVTKCRQWKKRGASEEWTGGARWCQRLSDSPWLALAFDMGEISAFSVFLISMYVKNRIISPKKWNTKVNHTSSENLKSPNAPESQAFWALTQCHKSYGWPQQGYIKHGTQRPLLAEYTQGVWNTWVCV